VFQVELVTVKKSEEKRNQTCLVTIKTYKEYRPFTLKAVVDSVTDRQMSVQEAQSLGILDQTRGVYHNKTTGDQLSLADALDSGLLVVEYDVNNHANGHTRYESLINLCSNLRLGELEGRGSDKPAGKPVKHPSGNYTSMLLLEMCVSLAHEKTVGVEHESLRVEANTKEHQWNE
jgi:hypothetical protein